MSQSNNYSSMNSKSATQNTMASHMHLGSNTATAKRHNSDVQTDIPTDITENHKLSQNPSMILQTRSNDAYYKTDTYCISPLDTIPNLRLGFIIIKLKIFV